MEDNLENFLSNISDRKIFFSLCEKTQPYLESIPHRYTEDGEYAMIYRALMRRDSSGMKSLIVNYDVASRLGYGEEKLNDLAVKNTPELFPPTIASLKDVLFGMTGNPPFLEENLVNGNMDKISIVSNEDFVFGAGAIYYDDHKILNQFADETQSNLFVLPSSVHEMLVLPDNGDVKSAELEEVIHEVNNTAVFPKERLGWKPLHFDRESNVLSLAEEKKEPAISQKQQKREPVHNQIRRGGR